MNDNKRPNNQEQHHQEQNATQNFFSRSKRRHENAHSVRDNQPRYASLPAVHPSTIPVITVVLSLIWWLKPIVSGTLGSQLHFEQIWPLLAYSLFCSAAIGYLVASRFEHKDWRLYACLLGSTLVLFSSSLRMRFEVLALLFLFLLVLALLPLNLVQLKNGIGLIALSTLVTFTVPVCIAFLGHNYVDQAFLKSSWDLFYGSLFYLTPLFLPKAAGRLMGLVTGALYLSHLLFFHAFGPGVCFSLVLALGIYTLSFIRPLTYRYQPIAAVIGLFLSVLAL
ncbi:hypothetical protein LQZ24_06095 [Fructobacillus sp. M1-13]|uniref:Integral membrane protein n=1 Tax=Fructobacillus papyriferae TaxID=2713171 RepID=A0ABS5QP63_9LACO|nr:hypothetical protein [Fructobacillus papyriferae]MBS9334948.1 hypothetical protein [Fructobacillus papyriferae]MCD2159568.1 hypothetical protein [Fructobacillus papyriferae]